MRKINLGVLMLVLSLGASAQTVDVPGTYATIQAAIDSFSADVTPQDNVVRITTVGPYAEVITLTYPVTLRGDTGGDRPILLLQSNGNYGIRVGNGSAFNGLENLILLPDRTSPPTSSGVRVENAGTECSFDNVLICPNDGSDQPVSTDPFVMPDLTGATIFPTWLIYCGASAEAVHLTNTVLTASSDPSRGAGSQDLMLVSSSASTTGMSTIGEGCIFSFADRYCIQVSQNMTIAGAVDNPVVLHKSGLNSSNFPYVYAIGAFGSGTQTLSLENVIISEAGSHAIQTYNAHSLVSMSHVAVVNCVSRVLEVYAGLQPMTITDSTFVGNGDLIYADATDVDISAADCIFAGTGTGGVNKIEIVDASQTFDLTNCAVVTAGAFVVEEATGAGTINQVSVIGDDPQFSNISNFLDPTFLDVYSVAYGSAGSGGAPLSGYGDYAAGPTPTPTITPVVAGTGTGWRDYR